MIPEHRKFLSERVERLETLDAQRRQGAARPSKNSRPMNSTPTNIPGMVLRPLPDQTRTHRRRPPARTRRSRGLLPAPALPQSHPPRQNLVGRTDVSRATCSRSSTSPRWSAPSPSAKASAASSASARKSRRCPSPSWRRCSTKSATARERARRNSSPSPRSSKSATRWKSPTARSKACRHHRLRRPRRRAGENPARIPRQPPGGGHGPVLHPPAPAAHSLKTA